MYRVKDAQYLVISHKITKTMHENYQIFYLLYMEDYKGTGKHASQP